MSRDSIRKRVAKLEAAEVDIEDMAVFGYLDDNNRLVDEQGKPIEAALFGVKE